MEIGIVDYGMANLRSVQKALAQVGHASQIITTEAEGWLAVMPETLIALISQNGNIYSVPVNIHRANVLWYNPAVLEANGVEVPATMDEWFTAMDTLKAAGVQPLALGEQWTKLHLLETVLLGSLGADA